MAEVNYAKGRGFRVEAYGDRFAFRHEELGQFITWQAAETLAGGVEDLGALLVQAMLEELRALPKAPPFKIQEKFDFGTLFGQRMIIETRGAARMMARIYRTGQLAKNNARIDAKLQKRLELGMRKKMGQAAKKARVAMKAVLQERVYDNSVGGFDGWGGKRIWGPSEGSQTLMQAIDKGTYLTEDALPTVMIGFDNEFIQSAMGGRSNVTTPYWMYVEFGHGITTPVQRVSGKFFPARPFHTEMIRAGQDAVTEEMLSVDWPGINRLIGNHKMRYLREYTSSI